MTFVNCTPHPLVVLNAAGVEVTFAPSGIVPRVATNRVAAPDLSGFRFIRTSFGAVEGLPAADGESTFIVSAMVLDALNGSRPDVVGPDTGADAIRNDKGHIVAVRGFVGR